MADGETGQEIVHGFLFCPSSTQANISFPSCSATYSASAGLFSLFSTRSGDEQEMAAKSKTQFCLVVVCVDVGRAHLSFRGL